MLAATRSFPPFTGRLSFLTMGVMLKPSVVGLVYGVTPLIATYFGFVPTNWCPNFSGLLVPHFIEI